MSQVLTQSVIVLAFFICVTPLQGQTANELQKLDLESFSKRVKKTPQRTKRELWSFFHKEAERLFNSEAYKNAKNKSLKAKILADKSGYLMLKYGTYAQLGKISVKLHEFDQAKKYFYDAVQFGRKWMELSPSKEFPKMPETAYLYYYRSWIYCHPDYLNPEIYLGFRFLRGAYVFSSRQKGSEYDDVFVKTSLHLARCFGLRGNHLAKLTWIREAEKRLSNSVRNKNEILFAILLESHNSLMRIGNNALAIQKLNRLESLLPFASVKLRLEYYRAIARLDLDINNYARSGRAFERVLDVAKESGNEREIARAYLELILKLLIDEKVEEAKPYLAKLEELDKSSRSLVNRSNLNVVRAIVAHYRGDFESTKRFFLASEQLLKGSERRWVDQRLLLSWQSRLAASRGDFDDLLRTTERYLDVVVKSQRLDSLSFIYRDRAKAFYRLGNLKAARSANRKAIKYGEPKRFVRAAEVSTGAFEHLFESYQLEIGLLLKEGKNEEALQLSEDLKARWLRDKVTGSAPTQELVLDPASEKEIFKFTLKLVDSPESRRNKKLWSKLAKMEQYAISKANERNSRSALSEASTNVVGQLQKSRLSDQTKMVSYVFDGDEKLIALTWQKGEGIQSVELNITSDEIDQLTKDLASKIKNQIYYKQDAKKAYDLLIKPLSTGGKRLVIVPTGALWKIPFQALSPDGKKYLIEEAEIAYAPSISVLLKHLERDDKLDRKAIQVFSNAAYNDLYLKFVDEEAKNLAGLYGVKPTTGATESRFRETASKSDILHFSMHAEVNKDEPFNSFLGFKPAGKDDGKLTVDELLKMKLKKGSLAFLASCDTTNVFNGEGLVSLAWAMMAAGSSTVVSAQWEANDKSTARFTNSFYKNLRQGLSSSEALQKASIEMINDKEANMSDPYYWAQFFLLGDYR